MFSSPFLLASHILKPIHVRTEFYFSYHEDILLPLRRPMVEILYFTICFHQIRFTDEKRLCFPIEKLSLFSKERTYRTS